MSEQQPSQPVVVKQEKPEKHDEKGEKGRGEKSWDEKWRRDPLNAAAWALILIWAGVVFLAGSINLLKGGFEGAWPVFFVGAGGILLLEVIFRLVVPSYRGPVVGTLILAAIFLGIGLSNLEALQHLEDRIWLLVVGVLVILFGVLLLFRGLFRRRQ